MRRAVSERPGFPPHRFALTLHTFFCARERAAWAGSRVRRTAAAVRRVALVGKREFHRI